MSKSLIFDPDCLQDAVAAIFLARTDYKRGRQKLAEAIDGAVDWSKAKRLPLMARRVLEALDDVVAPVVADLVLELLAEMDKAEPPAPPSSVRL